MSGISNLFNIGSSGLFAFQHALSVTAHNMANVNTKGYSKQEALLAEALPINGRPGQIGTGVQVVAVQRNVDVFINSQLLASRQHLGEHDASNSALSDIEDCLATRKTRVRVRISTISSRLSRMSRQILPILRPVPFYCLKHKPWLIA